MGISQAGFGLAGPLSQGMPNASPQSVEHLFVYGTLRRDSVSPMAEWLTARSSWLGPARARGTLYALNGYPGFVPDPEAGWVQGDVFSIADHITLFAALDDYEECAAHNPQPHEYARVVIDVRMGAATIPAWTYVYRYSTVGVRRIESGDFLCDER